MNNERYVIRYSNINTLQQVEKVTNAITDKRGWEWVTIPKGIEITIIHANGQTSVIREDEVNDKIEIGTAETIVISICISFLIAFGMYIVYIL